MRIPVLAALITVTVASASALASTPEPIGSWVLDCPTDTTEPKTCLLRFNKRFLEKAGITADLEVQASGKSLVPVVALRGLSPEMLMAVSMAGKIDASVQLSGGPRQDLACAPTGTSSYMCSPKPDTIQTLSNALPNARSISLRVGVTAPGLPPLPAQERTIDLTGTKDALAKLQAMGPTQIPSPMAAAIASQLPPGGMMEMADKALKAAGYPNGVAQLRAMMAKYMKK